MNIIDATTVSAVLVVLALAVLGVVVTAGVVVARVYGAGRVEMLRRFWGRRDAADLRKPNDRLREHYRRLYYARRTFPLYLPGRSDVQIASAGRLAVLVEDVF